jgi:hypothetical protein
MDFKDYTNLLASAKIISWEQASQINTAINALADIQELKQKEVEDDFWEKEGWHGSS